MKTLLITLEYPPQVGGVASYYSNLAKYWPDADGLSVLDNHDGGLMAPSGFWAWRRAFKTVDQSAKQEKPEYLIVGQILPLGIVIWLLSFVHKFKYSVCLHGMDFSLALKTTRRRFISRLILGRANKIICANSYLAGLVKKWRPELASKISIVNPGVEAASIADEIEITKWRKRQGIEDKFVLLSLGRLVKRKGFDVVINALRLLPPEILEKIVYIIGGTGPELENLKAAASDLPQVKFLGAISEIEKGIALSGADLFIMTPRDIKGDFEGFGIVYLEASLRGVPSIGTYSGGVADAIVDGQTGILVASDDPTAVATAMLKLYDNKDLRQKLGEAAKERAQTQFNWEGQARKFVA
jgi:phosphatidylinositol alpha-1,6-mannosyltransferase